MYCALDWPSSVPAGWKWKPNLTELDGISNWVAVWVGTVESNIANVLPPAVSVISKDVPAPFFLDKNWIVVVSSKCEKPIQSVGTVAGSTNALSAKPTNQFISVTSVTAILVSYHHCLAEL